MEKTRLCRLEETAGRRVACPGDACAFWDPGSPVAEGHCVLEGIDFAREPGLADWLLEFRAGLEAARTDQVNPAHALRHALSQGRE